MPREKEADANAKMRPDMGQTFLLFVYRGSNLFATCVPRGKPFFV